MVSAPRIGVVGGGIRGSMFATAVRQHADARLLAVTEPALLVREQVSGRLGINGYGDVEAMLAAEQLDAVIIATPDFAHHDVAVRCAEHGLQLLVEKPLATSSAEAESMIAAAETAGVRIMVGFENRWNPRFAAIRHQLADGSQGAVINQVAHLNDTVFVPTTMLSWAGRSSPAWFLMPHTLDLTMWLSGAEPVDVFARGVRRLLPERGVDTFDAVSASFAMSDGSLVTLESQWVLPESAPSVFDFRYEINTERASYRVDISDTGVHRYDADGVSWLQFGAYEHHGHLRGVPIDMAGDFIAVLNGADIDVPDGHHGLRVTRAVEAVHRSLQTGQPEPIEPADRTGIQPPNPLRGDTSR